MKIGIIGCGLNADYHINFAKSYPGAQIVGVVDKDRDKAKECAERFGVINTFHSIKDLVEQEKPDVVHVVTPPKTHFALTKEAIEIGCNVLVEKPLALNTGDAESLFEEADRRSVKLCTMHNHFFDPCMVRARELIETAQLGDVINVESYYGINTQIPAFREYPIPNVLPWLYELPGGVYHDFMAHPLYVMLDYTGKPREMKVMERSYGVLPQNMSDEIRILVNGERAFGTLIFSFAARPHLHFIRIYGTKGMIEVDINTMTIVVHPLSSLPKAAQRATYNFSEAWQLSRSTISNVVNFLSGKLKPYHGMKTLIHAFYDSIKSGSKPPVSRRQALVVLQTMDEIWKQMNIRHLDFTPMIREYYPYLVKHKEKVLVTGGTGFLGKRLTEQLVAEGYAVRVLARKLSNIEPLKALGAEIFFGDVGDEGSLGEALKGINLVIHAAAGTSGSKKDCETGTMLGTRNVLKLCRANGIGKLIYISSCSVYGVVDYKTNQVVTEESSLERFPSQRGNYSASKQQAEALVTEAMNSEDFPIVVLRPGTIYGPGGEIYTPMMGISLASRVFLVFGSRKFELPLVYVDNLIDGILQSMSSSTADNQIFNVLDTERITKALYMQKLVEKVYPKSHSVYLPYSLIYCLTWAQEKVFRVLRRTPFLTRYRLISSQRQIRYDTSKIRNAIGWQPRVSFDQAVAEIVSHESGKVVTRVEKSMTNATL